METEEPFELPAAWEQVRDLLGYIVALFGAPGAIAARMFLRAASRLEILQWLAPVEALARRLLAIEALGLAPPNAPPPTARTRDARVASRLADLAPADCEPGAPETWRVVFNLAPGSRASALPVARDAGAEREGAPPMLRNALALARRLEALRRLAEDRGAALRRMVRLLAARRGQVRARFALYAPRGRLRVCPAGALLEITTRQLALSFAADTS